MSREIFIRPVHSMSGKVKQDSNTSHRTRNGKTFTYTWNEDNKEIISPAKTLQQYAMKLANLRTTDILADSSKRSEFEQAFNQSSDYSELRPFIVALQLKAVKAEVMAGNIDTINILLDLVRQHPDRQTREAKIAALQTFLKS